MSQAKRHGAAGSTQPLTRRMTSSSGRRQSPFLALSTASRHALSSYFGRPDNRSDGSPPSWRAEFGYTCWAYVTAHFSWSPSSERGGFAQLMGRILGSHVMLTSAWLVGPPQLDLNALMEV